MRVDSECCCMLNTMCLFFDGDCYKEPKVSIIPCCQWLNNPKEVQEMIPIDADLNSFFDSVEDIRCYLYNNQQKICPNCIVNEKGYEPFTLFPKKLIIAMGTVCNLNCPYCFSSVITQRETLPKCYLENKEAVEKIVADKRIETVSAVGHGEFFANRDLMNLFSGWKENYGKKLSAITNLTLYDSEYPLDRMEISWHKSADKEKFISNLGKIPSALTNIPVYMMVGKPKYAFSLNEAFELVKNHLDPARFTVTYVGLTGKRNGELLCDEYTELEIRNVVNKTQELGFDWGVYNRYKTF